MEQASTTIDQSNDLNVSQKATVKNKSDDFSPQQPSTPNSSLPSSPTKSTPTKSRNKKKNDAKKRSAKKQQQSTATKGAITNDSKAIQNVIKQESLTLSNNQTQSQTQLMEIEPAIPEVNVESTQSQDLVLSIRQQDELQTRSSNGDTVETKNVDISKNSHDTDSWRRKQREIKELKEQIKIRDSKLQILTDKCKQQINRTKELESSLIISTRKCGQFERIIQQKIASENRLELENKNLNQTLTRLKNQINVHEKNKATNDELIRVLNATLMERETEVSILKLKMTRLQTNPAVNQALTGASSVSSMKQDPTKAYTSSGRSNSEFCRNSYMRSSMMAEAASARSSTSQLQAVDKDASIWANVPEELTPSKRPLLLDRNFQPIYSDSHYNSYTGNRLINMESSTPLMRGDRRYKTLPRSMKSPSQEFSALSTEEKQVAKLQNNTSELDKSSRLNLPSQQPSNCLVTNLDDSNSTSQSSGGNRTKTIENLDQKSDESESKNPEPGVAEAAPSNATVVDDAMTREVSDTYVKNIPGEYNLSVKESSNGLSVIADQSKLSVDRIKHIGIPMAINTLRSPITPVKKPTGIRKIFGRFRRSDSSADSKSKPDLMLAPEELVPKASNINAFQRGATRSTLVGPPNNIRAQLTPTRKPLDFERTKPFAEWDTDMLADWLTSIGLNTYATQCKRWVKCGAHIMNATPAEVDKGLGIINPLHRKKLRLAISELNGDCDKITKAAAKLDYLWVARWLDDIGLPQHKDAFIEARVDGRVLNYLTVEDLVSMGVKSVLHHSSIKCGIRVLRSIGFDLQLLKRRATADEVEQMNSMRQNENLSDQTTTSKLSGDPTEVNSEIESEIPMWTCHRVMEWLRMIDFAEFAPNLRGSGVHGGLIMYEDRFNIETLCSLLSIPSSKTLLRRHLSSYFDILIGDDLVQRKRQFKGQSTSQQLNPAAEIRTPKKSPWFSKLRNSKVGQDVMDEYLCPMYPVEAQLVKNVSPKKVNDFAGGSNLPRIPESINV